jgi:hypothetical protein
VARQPHRTRPPRRIVGVVADVDDENVVQVPTMTVYLPWRQLGEPSRLFVRAAADPYALVPAVTRTLHDISADQAVERPATLEDVRTQVLTPQRLNAFVFSASAASRCSSRSSASRACWRSRWALGRVSSASGSRSDASRASSGPASSARAP